MVSNISTISRVMSTAMIEAIGAENSSGKPTKHLPNIEKSTCGTQLVGAVMPIGTLNANWQILPITAVMIMPTKIAPGTFWMTRIVIMINPARARITDGSVKLARSTAVAAPWF